MSSDVGTEEKLGEGRASGMPKKPMGKNTTWVIRPLIYKAADKMLSCSSSGKPARQVEQVIVLQGRKLP